MKILIKKWDNKYYVWQDATWKDGAYYVDRYLVKQTEILAIKDDNRGKYVRCSHCGAVIEDDPKAIEQHFAESESKKDCMKCRYIRMENIRNKTTNYTQNEDGTYRAISSADVDLMCTNIYPSQNINTMDFTRYCLHYRCRKAGVKPISDVFMQYPGLFNKQITVDLLKSKGFEFDGFSNGYFVYDLKMRNTLKACVNELGIVDHFRIKHRGYSYNAYYSEKYDELFYASCGTYITREPDDVSDAKHNQSKNKISALYKEASK
jgi:transcription initiation factor TFIIIB Brf1 subunit/transcription initiation factor TFIIB